MRTLAAVFSLMILAGLCEARAGDAETIAAVNASSNALDQAFAARDVAAIKALMTPDHVSVTPYYDGPQSVDDQLASLSELDYGQTIVGEPSVALLSPDVALRTFIADFNGSFKGKPLAPRLRQRDAGEA
jgi:ketosteroid isomerase-like protein